VGEALEEIVEHDGILYDRQVVDALYRVIKKFPLAGYV
jgi:HD-GYP domain-containing protein (c-di-GMP phosphodiesterase class II)